MLAALLIGVLLLPQLLQQLGALVEGRGVLVPALLLAVAHGRVGPRLLAPHLIKKRPLPALERGRRRPSRRPTPCLAATATATATAPPPTAAPRAQFVGCWRDAAARRLHHRQRRAEQRVALARLALPQPDPQGARPRHHVPPRRDHRAQAVPVAGGGGAGDGRRLHLRDGHRRRRRRQHDARRPLRLRRRPRLGRQARLRRRDDERAEGVDVPESLVFYDSVLSFFAMAAVTAVAGEFQAAFAFLGSHAMIGLCICAVGSLAALGYNLSIYYVTKLASSLTLAVFTQTIKVGVIAAAAIWAAVSGVRQWVGIAVFVLAVAFYTWSSWQMKKAAAAAVFVSRQGRGGGGGGGRARREAAAAGREGEVPRRTAAPKAPGPRRRRRSARGERRRRLGHRAAGDEALVVTLVSARGTVYVSVAAVPNAVFNNAAAFAARRPRPSPVRARPVTTRVAGCPPLQRQPHCSAARGSRSSVAPSKARRSSASNSTFVWPQLSAAAVAEHCLLPVFAAMQSGGSPNAS